MYILQSVVGLIYDTVNLYEYIYIYILIARFQVLVFSINNLFKFSTKAFDLEDNVN